MDDDPAHLRAICRLLSSERWSANGFGSVEEALEGLERETGSYDALLTDLYMPGAGGLALLRAVRERWPSVTPVLMTGRADMESAIDAMRSGAYDYLVKPVDGPTLMRSLGRAVERSRLLTRNLYVERQLDVATRSEGLVGSSRAMHDVLTLIATVAPTDATVLILGESGTGKELVARSVHRQSTRSGKAFIGLNCGALAETVLESELFGHVRGAFTGATSGRRGLFEEASGGTLFLDEVGELTPATQVRLLRVLQEGEVRPVGSNRAIPVDVRIVAATNRDLRAQVKAGTFRQDLFYRLEVVTIELPPLRKRLEDLPILVDHLIKKRAVRSGRTIAGIEESALVMLAAHQWPGNVRELENVLERALVMTRGDRIGVAALPATIRASAPPSLLAGGTEPLPPLSDARDAFERGYAREVLSRADGNLTVAAKIAGLDRSNFRRLLRRLGLDAPPSSDRETARNKSSDPS